MPIYEYECESCGVFEHIQGFSDKALTTCPACKESGRKSKVQRLISTSAFHLKGSGWYVTDFKDKNNKSSKPAKNNQDSKSSIASSSETSSSSTESSKPAKTACSSGCSCH